MGYSEESTSIIEKGRSRVVNDYKDLCLKITFLNANLSDQNSRVYLMEGVYRRLAILYRCIDNVFDLFPLERKELLSKNELDDLNINLHAFFINIYGIIDNLAWVFVHENDLHDKLSKYDIGLFCKKTQKYLPAKLKEHMESASLEDWYSKYCKDYRDALAHRIPLYVPPAALNNDETETYNAITRQQKKINLAEQLEEYEELIEQQKQLGRPCVLIAHSPNEEHKKIYFHAQLIADFNTIREIIKIFCDDFGK